MNLGQKMSAPTKPTLYANLDAARYLLDEAQAEVDRLRAELSIADQLIATLRRKVESFHRGILLGVPGAGVAGYLVGQFL